MDKKTVFIKTSKGENEVKGKGGSLSGDLKRALFLVDDKSTFDEVSKRAAPSLREVLSDVFQQLTVGGYIRDKAKPFAEPQITAPKIITPASNGELDFTGLLSSTAQNKISVEADKTNKDADAVRARSEFESAVEAAKMKARAEAEAKADANAKLAAEMTARNKIEADTRAKQDALLREQAEARANQEAEARMRAEQAAAQAKFQLEAVAKAKAEAEALAREQIEIAARAKQEAEIRAKQEAEVARIKAEQEAARIKAELEAAAKAKAEADEARIKAEQEAVRIRAELEAAKAKAEADAKALAEERIKQEAEAARLKAEQEAEAKRLKAEQDAARVKAELEAAKAKAEAEARALAEERLKQAAEAARLKAEQEAARVKAELENANAKAASEAKALAEERLKQEAEATRLKVEQEATRIKAEQESAKAKAEAEASTLAERLLTQEAEAARLKAEQETARIKTELEATKAKAEAEITKINAGKTASVTESTTPKSIDVDKQEALALKAHEEKRLAEEQAKAWAAAEQRAKEQAKVEAARSTQAVDTTPAKAAPQRNTSMRRKPFPFCKVTAGLFVLALLAIVLIPYVMPLNNYVAPIEQKLSAQFKQPVHVGNLRAATLPWPKLQLEKITVGSAQELKVDNAIVTFDLLSIFSETKIIRGVELQNVSLDGALLDKELTWLQQIGNNANYHVSHVTVQQAKISSEEVSLPTFSGELDINEQGLVNKVTLKSGDAKFDVGLQPSSQDHWQITLNAKETSFPMFSNVLFNDFSAKGEISTTGVNFVGIEGQAYGGFLRGNAKLNWQKGWQLQGHIEARSIELSKLFPKFGVTGELVGESNFTSSSIKLGKLADTPQMEGSFVVKKGVINGMDMVETARQGNRQNVSSGRTHFDELTGSFQANGHGQRFQQLKITSGILNGNGSFDVNTGTQISGRFSVELKARGGTSSLALTGTLTEPVLRSVR